MRSWKPAAIVNPRAGRGRATGLWRSGRTRLEARFGRIEVRQTVCPGHASELARELRGAGYDLLFVAGGDGTLNEIANGLLGGGTSARDITLAPLAAGNCSDLARALGVSAGGAVRWIDAVHAGFRDARGDPCERWFVNMASFGLGAEVVRRGGGRGRAGYLLAAAATLAGFHAVPLRLILDGVVVEASAVHVAVGNGVSQGGGMRVCPRALLDDGLLDVTVIGDVGLADLAANLRLIYSGRIYEHPKVRHFRAALLRAEAETGLELDGDPVGFLPAEFRVERGALSVLGNVGTDGTFPGFRLAH
ncbi:MAG: diacylglycerol kinase family lipid kinase [Acidobacteria bacterium]|nr:diacylglycerol kinase family lipid kinase [Acidobacteriota bacterium]